MSILNIEDYNYTEHKSIRRKLFISHPVFSEQNMIESNICGLNVLDLNNVSQIEYLYSLLNKDISDKPSILSLLHRTIYEYNNASLTEQQLACWLLAVRLLWFQNNIPEVSRDFKRLYSSYTLTYSATRFEMILCRALVDRFCLVTEAEMMPLFYKRYIIPILRDNIKQYFTKDKWDNATNRVIVLYSILGLLFLDNKKIIESNDYQDIKKVIQQEWVDAIRSLITRYIQKDIKNLKLKDIMDSSFQSMLIK